jgi:hypothetical protein
MPKELPTGSSGVAQARLRWVVKLLRQARQIRKLAPVLNEPARHC